MLFHHSSRTTSYSIIMHEIKVIALRSKSLIVNWAYLPAVAKHYYPIGTWDIPVAIQAHKSNVKTFLFILSQQ